MKKLKINWTFFALKCLNEISEYIIDQSGSEITANNYVNKLIDRVEQLQNFPNSGQEEELLAHLNKNSRYLVEGNYKIIYQHLNDKITVTDIFHVKQNPIKINKRNKK
jgi:toxin ParE1/3/4